MSRLIKPTRRLFLASAVGIITAPAIVRAGSLSLLGVGKPAVGGVTAFAWDPATAPLTAVFSNSNRNFDNGSAANWHSAKTTISKSSLSFYLELKVTTLSTTQPQTGVGFADAGFTSTTAGNYLGSADKSVMFYMGTQATFASAFFTVANACTMTTWAVNDIIQLCADFTNGRAWIGQQNVWKTSGGDPTLGASGFPWLTWTGGQALFFAGMQFGNTNNGTLSLTSTTTGTVPSGFSVINA